MYHRIVKRVFITFLKFTGPKSSAVNFVLNFKNLDLVSERSMCICILMCIWAFFHYLIILWMYNFYILMNV